MSSGYWKRRRVESFASAFALREYLESMSPLKRTNVEARHISSRLKNAGLSFIEARRAKEMRRLLASLDQGVDKGTTGGADQPVLSSDIVCLLDLTELLLCRSQAFHNLHVLQSQADQFLQNIIQNSRQLIRFDSWFAFKSIDRPCDGLDDSSTFLGNSQCHLNVIKADRANVHADTLQNASDAKLPAATAVAKSVAAGTTHGKIQCCMSSGWWLIPALIVGAVGWAVLLWAVT